MEKETARFSTTSPRVSTGRAEVTGVGWVGSRTSYEGMYYPPCGRFYTGKDPLDWQWAPDVPEKEILDYAESRGYSTRNYRASRKKELKSERKSLAQIQKKARTAWTSVNI